MSTRKVYWTAASLWTSLIFFLMLEGRPLINFTKIHAQFPLLIFMIYTVLAALLLLLLFHRLALRKPSTHLLLLAVFLIYAWVLSQVKELEEIAHFVEYGVLSVLVYRALACDLKGMSVWGLAFLLTAGIGTLEETLQLWVPARIFDPHDIRKNILAVLFGLLFAAIVEREKRLDAGSNKERSSEN